jgi:hypothetical protein
MPAIKSVLVLRLLYALIINQILTIVTVILT